MDQLIQSLFAGCSNERVFMLNSYMNILNLLRMFIFCQLYSTWWGFEWYSLTIAGCIGEVWMVLADDGKCKIMDESTQDIFTVSFLGFGILIILGSCMCGCYCYNKLSNRRELQERVDLQLPPPLSHREHQQVIEEIRQLLERHPLNRRGMIQNRHEILQGIESILSARHLNRQEMQLTQLNRREMREIQHNLNRIDLLGNRRERILGIETNSQPQVTQPTAPLPTSDTNMSEVASRDMATVPPVIESNDAPPPSYEECIEQPPSYDKILTSLTNNFDDDDEEEED